MNWRVEASRFGILGAIGFALVPLYDVSQWRWWLAILLIATFGTFEKNYGAPT